MKKKTIVYSKVENKIQREKCHHSSILIHTNILIYASGTPLGSTILLSPSPVIHTLYHTGDKSFSIFSLKQKRPGPEGRVLSQSSGMDFPVAFESPQLTEGCVTLGAHVGLEPRVGASVNIEVPSVAKSSVTLLTAERLLLGVGPLVSAQGGVVGELLEAEITAVGLLASVDPLVNPQI